MKITFKWLFILSSTLLLFACASGKKHKSKYMQSTFQDLKEQLKDAVITMENDSIKVTFSEHLMFATNSAVIEPAFIPHVVNFAKVLNKHHKTSVLVNGYTDNTGTREYNNKLSSDRANNARQALVDNKVDEKRVYAWGHGPNDPIASNDTPEGRQKNRRVEFVILYDVK